MATPRVKSDAPRSKKEAPSRPAAEPSFDFYINEIRKKGKTTIPCPYGMGWYHIRSQGTSWYETPEIIFQPGPDCPHPYNDMRLMSPARFRTNQGRVIPWYPKTGGSVVWRYAVTYREESGVKVTNRQYMLQLCEYLIGIVLSGRRLYKLKCGQGISSLNDDDGNYQLLNDDDNY